MCVKYLVVATKEELLLPRAKDECDRLPIVTGVGATNVIKALRNISKDSDILNVGYCGSLYFPVGEVVNVQYSRLYHPGVSFEEEIFELNGPRSGITCLTAGDFVTEPRGFIPMAVVDMELAYIAALGFKKVTSIKYISDNLNLKEYELCLKK